MFKYKKWGRLRILPYLEKTWSDIQFFQLVRAGFLFDDEMIINVVFFFIRMYNKNTIMQNQRKINIVFGGDRVETGEIDVYDLTSTILAFSQIVDVIATREQLTKKGKVSINVNALRPGSFDIQLAITVHDMINAVAGATPLLAVLTSENLSDFIVKIFQEALRVKKFLKGQKPKQISVVQNGDNNVALIINVEGDSTNTLLPVVGLLQDHKANKAFKKMLEPITKENANVEEIQFKPDTEFFSAEAVTLREAEYFLAEDDLQTMQDYTLKGVVTAFDRKTGTGRLSVSDLKRIIFELSYGVDIKVIEVNELLLIESMKLKVPVYIRGEAMLDFATDVKKITVSEVKAESNLFPDINE